MQKLEQRFLAKLIMTLELNHNGCKQEVIKLLKNELGLTVEHNELREMINKISDEQVDQFLRDNNIY